MNELASRKCHPVDEGSPSLSDKEVRRLLSKLPGWGLDGEKISRTFEFADFLTLMSFVNAAAWISHRQDHHPDISFTYSSVRVSYWTHTVGGLSENDFICAAKLNQLIDA